MKLLLMISALFVASALVVAAPVETAGQADNLVNEVLEKPQFDNDQPTVDVTDLINDMRRLHESASDVIQQVEVTLSTLKSLMPHSIRKRQTTVDGDVVHDQGGTRGRIDVTHTSGDTTYDGHISHGPGGTNYGAGVNHKDGDNNYGASVNHGPGGTGYEANYGRTFDHGRGSFGVGIGQDAGGGAYGGVNFGYNW